MKQSDLDNEMDIQKCIVQTPNDQQSVCLAPYDSQIKSTNLPGG